MRRVYILFILLFLVIAPFNIAAQETFYVEMPEGLQDIVYLDGTYFGESSDFVVEILIYQNEIRNISVIELKNPSHRRHIDGLLELIDRIIEKQNTDELLETQSIIKNDFRFTFLFAVRNGLFQAIEKYSQPYSDPFLQALKLANDYIIFQDFYFGTDPQPPIHEDGSKYQVTYDIKDLKIVKDVLVDVKTRNVIFEP